MQPYKIEQITELRRANIPGHIYKITRGFLLAETQLIFNKKDRIQRSKYSQTWVVHLEPGSPKRKKMPAWY